MPTATASHPSDLRSEPYRTSTSRRAPGPGRVLVRLLTVLVGLATAVVTLGPASVVVGGMSVADTWLAAHPDLGRLVERLGGVEPAGNLVLFVPFAALLALCFRLRVAPLVFALLVCAPFAVEWVQRFLPGRVPDGNDIVRNTIGLLAAFGAVSIARLVARGVRGTARAVLR